MIWRDKQSKSTDKNKNGRVPQTINMCDMSLQNDKDNIVVAYKMTTQVKHDCDPDMKKNC